MATPQARKLYAVTIFGYRKDGMNEQDYHDYISKIHAGHLKALLAENNIVSYTMVHELLQNLRTLMPLFREQPDTDCLPNEATQHFRHSLFVGYDL